MNEVYIFTKSGSRVRKVGNPYYYGTYIDRDGKKGSYLVVEVERIDTGKRMLVSPAGLFLESKDQ